MSGRLATLAASYDEQAAALTAWLVALPDDDFARPSVLSGWDVRTLLGHVVRAKEQLLDVLDGSGAGPPLPVHEYVAGYGPAAAEIAHASRDWTGARSVTALLDSLRAPLALPAAATGRTVVAGPRGAITALDWLRTRLLDLVVHTDDLSRSLPELAPAPIPRAGLADAVRLLAELLAAKAPGRSVEVRVPPFVAVQAVPGPRHTRGTPPNVVETDPLTWLRVATGRVPFASAAADGRVRATGPRSDLAPHLPVLA